MTARNLSAATMLVALAAAAMLALPSVAPAQDGSQRAARAEKLAERFKAADKDGDGQLTKAEAEAGMPRLAKHFDAIDSAKTGRVSLEQVKTWMIQQGPPRGGAKASPAA